VVEHLGARSILEVRVEGPNIEFKAPTDEKVHLNGNGAKLAEPQPQPEPLEQQAAPEPAAAKKRKRPSRKVLIFVVVLVVLAALVGGGAYLVNASKYVSTDNAQVDGDKVDINAPATGTLVSWQGEQGASVTTNEIMGRIRIGNSGAQPQMTIKSPGNGTIAVKNAVEGQWVTSGTNLATAYDFNKIYVTARVDETDLEGVHLGAPVDISVDAFPGAPITGVVTQIQGAAANQFSLFPESNSTGNFQKVTQVVAVRVAFTNTDGQAVVPGMNVTVHIHKN
jgi:multidrug resistance efflux pump